MPTAPSADADSRERVIAAAGDTILERGFYRASSNEIARRAGVTWGVIQHHFGTRDRLMLAVLEDAARRFVDLVAQHEVTGETTEDRIADLVDLFGRHYGSPSYWVHLQVQLNLDHDPSTSVDIHRTMGGLAETAMPHVRRLLLDALGPAGADPDLATTVFITLRGFGISQLLVETEAYSAPMPGGSEAVTRQRRLLAKILTAYLAGASRPMSDRRASRLALRRS